VGGDGQPGVGERVTSTGDGAAAFESARPKLMAIAYRMLGSVVEAEDVVGDVAERWASADQEAVQVPEAWLVTATTRRALDVLRSARLQRESYPGVWLPEPVTADDEVGAGLERAETLTMGFLLLLERLTPLERAVFVLHDALDYHHDEIAEAVGRTPAACRQALHRARKQVAVPERRTEADRAHAARVAERFLTAGVAGDVDALLATLAPGVVLTSDGGGIVHAAIRPVVGPRRVSRLITNLIRRTGQENLLVVPCEVNGSPGAVVNAGATWLAYAVEVDGDRVAAIRVVVSPAKLERLVARLPEAAGRPGPWATRGRFRHRRGQPVR
jgi:RNA polymerase sigma-70 factor (ECF subfamily)